MTTLGLGLVLFLGIHSVAVVGLRDRAAAAVGLLPWKGLYSLVAGAGLVLIVIGYGLARQAPSVLFVPPIWSRHLALVLMLPVFPLLLAAYLPGRIRTATRHPMLAATTLWAAAHLIANGMLADLLLFGSVGAWSVIDRVSLDRRPERAIPTAPATPLNDGIAVVVGLLLYGATVGGLHLWLIGVPPIAL